MRIKWDVCELVLCLEDNKYLVMIVMIIVVVIEVLNGGKMGRGISWGRWLFDWGGVLLVVLKGVIS